MLIWFMLCSDYGSLYASNVAFTGFRYRCTSKCGAFYASSTNLLRLHDCTFFNAHGPSINVRSVYTTDIQNNFFGITGGTSLMFSGNIDVPHNVTVVGNLIASERADEIIPSFGNPGILSLYTSSSSTCDEFRFEGNEVASSVNYGISTPPSPKLRDIHAESS